MEGEPQVNSVKRTCGRAKVARKGDWNVPLHLHKVAFVRLLTQETSRILGDVNFAANCYDVGFPKA